MFRSCFRTLAVILVLDSFSLSGFLARTLQACATCAEPLGAGTDKITNFLNPISNNRDVFQNKVPLSTIRLGRLVACRWPLTSEPRLRSAVVPLYGFGICMCTTVVTAATDKPAALAYSGSWNHSSACVALSLLH